MRKYLAAGLVGLALVATQAAASDSAVLRLGDRVGSSSSTQNNLFGLPLFAFLFTAGLIGFVSWAAVDAGGAPASP
ncbi:MAG: hypothetical protein WDM85_18150 [Caulobacteraceae bacterium]